ncbi:hypothetical protein GALL_436360 [mine drainage metagenome]|uniref:Uncharacterized protein n=1 Tax=mine drainage metagenome TaxID=410659 RepID=A0A1J5QB38_9ZZZZ
MGAGPTREAVGLLDLHDTDQGVREVGVQADAAQFLEAGIAVGLGKQRADDAWIERDGRIQLGEILRAQGGRLGDEARQLLVGKAVHRHALVLVQRGQFHRPGLRLLGRNGDLSVEHLFQQRGQLDLGHLEQFGRKEETPRFDLDGGFTHIAPDRLPAGLVRRRRIVPRQDGPHLDQRVENAEPAQRIDGQRGGEFQPLPSFGALRDVEGLEAGHALVLPARSLVEGQVEAHIFRRAGAADVAAVARRLVDVDDGFQVVLLRMEADAAHLLVMGVAADRQHRLEWALEQVAKVVGIGQHQRLEPPALTGMGLLHAGRRFLDRLLEFAVHGCTPRYRTGRSAFPPCCWTHDMTSGLSCVMRFSLEERPLVTQGTDQLQISYRYVVDE